MKNLIAHRGLKINNSKENTEKYTIKVINNRHNDLVYIMGNIYYYNYNGFTHFKENRIR